MLQFLFDTDHLTLYDQGHALVGQQYAAEPAGSVGICPVTVQETFRGRLLALVRHPRGPGQVQAYAHLVHSLQLCQQFPIVPFDLACEHEYQQLRSARVRIGSQDLKIAAVAKVNGLTVLTRNRRDFGLVPGLSFTDWSV